MTEKTAISQNESPTSKDKHSEKKRRPKVGEDTIRGHPPIHEHFSRPWQLPPGLFKEDACATVDTPVSSS